MGQGAQQAINRQEDIQQALIEIKKSCKKIGINYEQVKDYVNYLNNQNYECISLIGKGSFGFVLKAKFKNEYIAIKVIEAKDIKKAQNLTQEYWMLQNFKNSQYILQSQQLQTAYMNEANVLFIFTNLCEGELTELIRQKISKKQILIIMIQLLLGLEELKQAKMIHADLKPSNILYNQRNGVYNIQIAGFGQAKQFNNEEYVYDLTNIGTRKYMSLEVLDENKKISYKADVYSLGIVFIELIFGKFFDFDTEIKPLRNGNLEILNKRQQVENRDFNQFDDFLIENIIKNMIKKDQQERKSSKELLDIIFKKYLRDFDFNQIIDYGQCLKKIQSLYEDNMDEDVSKLSIQNYSVPAANVELNDYFTQNVQKLQQTTNEQDEEDGSANQTQYLQKAKQIAKKITIKTIRDSKNFDMNTITQVMEYSLELADQEYVDLTLKNRKDRREKMTEDINEYKRLILQYNEDVENIIKKAQSTILEILEIPYEDFEDSIIAFMEKGHYQELYMFQALNRQKIKENLKPTKNVGIDEVKKILTFQLNLLQQKPELLKSIIKKLSQSNETVQFIPVILGTLIKDYVYKEYKVEEEDQIQVMEQPSFLEDTDMVTLIQQVEQAMFEAMGAMGNMEGGLFE
ncbi:hypothetical protein ABPG74_000589 [Tetrahymena malaccensis]